MSQTKRQKQETALAKLQTQLAKEEIFLLKGKEDAKQTHYDVETLTFIKDNNRFYTAHIPKLIEEINNLKRKLGC